MLSINYSQRNKFYVLGQWVLCGGLCVLLGACSTLGLTGNKQVKSSSTPSSNPANTLAADKEVDSQTIQTSYRSSASRNPVNDLPDALDYSIDTNRQRVEELNTAPEWMRTPEELAPSPYQIQPPAPPELDNTPAEETDLSLQQHPEPQEQHASTVDSAVEVDLPWIDDMSRASIKEAIRKQLKVMEETDLTRRVRFGNRKVTRQQLINTLHAFTELLEQDVSIEEFNRLLNEQFELISAGYHRAGRPVLFTGYYMKTDAGDLPTARPVKLDLVRKG